MTLTKQQKQETQEQQSQQNLINFIKSTVGFFYGLFFNKISYSQYGEDLIIEQYFNKIKINKGTYLDIGSFHPIWLSNTNLFYKKGWFGYCVDLDENKLLWFRICRRKKVKTICAAVVENTYKKKYITVYKFNRKFLFSEVDTVSKNIANKVAQFRSGFYKKIKIKSEKINELFKKVGKINFLKIDIEGLDEKVILSSNLSLIDPNVILY